MEKRESKECGMLCRKAAGISFLVQQSRFLVWDVLLVLV